MHEKDVNITIRQRKKGDPARTNFSPVNINSREGLNNLRVVDLRSLVRQHNLHNTIKGYSSMKKADIITAFLHHKKKQTATSSIRIKRKKVK